MIKVKIKTIWHGKVGIRDKYVEKARREKDDICIVKGNDMMIVPFEKIGEAIVGKSEFPMKDRYSKENHYLLYFHWRPTTVQQKLF